MKKLLILSIGFVFLITEAQAQRGWSFGDKISIGHSWTVGNNPKVREQKRIFHPSMQIGRNAVYHFNNNLGLGFGAFFSTEGGSFKSESLSGTPKIILRSNYLRVPVFASFKFGNENNKIRPRLAIGPSVGFLIGGKNYKNYDDGLISGEKTVKFMDTKIDAGANVSIGLNIKLTEGLWINHDINYYHGFVEQKPNRITGDPSYTLRNLDMSLGFLINSDAMKFFKGNMNKVKYRSQSHKGRR